MLEGIIQATQYTAYTFALAEIYVLGAIQRVKIIHPYGFYGHAPKNSHVQLLCEEAKDNMVGIADDVNNRPITLYSQEHDIVIYNTATKNYIQLDTELKNINIVSNNEINVTSISNINVTTTGNLTTNATGNTTINTNGNTTVKTTGNTLVDTEGSTTVESVGDITLTTNGNISLNALGSLEGTIAGDATLTANNISLNGSCNLGVNGEGLARIGDSVQVLVTGGSSSGIHNGKITSGSTYHKAN